jgi:Tfp pilus assembly protein PilV
VTIIEVLVASAILAIGLVGVGSLVTYGVVSHRKSVNYTIAEARAVKELERVRDAKYVGAVVNSTLFPSSEYTILNSTQARFTVSELKNGYGIITITDDAQAQQTNPATGQPYSNLKKVKVEIHWTGGGRNLGGYYNAATLIANRP